MDSSGLIRETLTNLAELGVQNENIGFANVSMQAENFVCVRESRQSGRSSVKIMDLRKGIEISEKPVSADSIIMNPESAHMALRALGAIQVFDLDTKAKVASVSVDFEIAFWAWIDKKTLAMVSNDFVYKWSYLEADSEPEVSFEKSDSLNECQIINVQEDHTGRWCILTGIQLKNGRIVGTIQLYNHDKQLSQMIEGHSGCFFQAPSPKDGVNYSLLSFASRGQSELKIHVVEIDHIEDTPVFSKKVIELSTVEMNDNDFPINLLFDSKAGLLVAYTKFGHVFVVEPFTATCIHSERISESPLYLACPSRNRSNHYVFNRQGDISKCHIDPSKMLKTCLSKGIQFYASASHISNHVSNEEQHQIYRNHFDELKNSERHREALVLVAKSKKAFMRSFEYMTMIKEFPHVNNTTALLEYFAIILQDGSLNEAESIELAQLALKKNKLELLKKWSADNKIHYTSQLGSLIIEADTSLAFEIFESVNDIQKAALASCMLESFEYINEHDDVDLVSIIDYLSKDHKEAVVKLTSYLLSNQVDLVTKEVISALLAHDLEASTSDLDLDLSKHPQLFTECSTEAISKFVDRLGKNHPENLFNFLNSPASSKLKNTEELIAKLKEQELYSAVFCLIVDYESALSLIEDQPEIMTADYQYVSLKSHDISKLIAHLIQKDNIESIKFCATLGRLVSEADFERTKTLLTGKLSEDELLDFLTFWSSKIQSDSVAQEIILANLKLKNYERVDDICRQVEFSDPDAAFEILKKADYKCNALVIIATRYALEVKLISLYSEKQDDACLNAFVEEYGNDRFFGLLPVLVGSIDEDFIRSVLKCPEDKGTLIEAAEALKKENNLNLIDEILQSCPWKDDKEIISFRAKIICLQNDSEAFADFVTKHQSILDLKQELQYAEEKSPVSALSYYRVNGKSQEFVKLSIKIEDWDKLSRYLIGAKQQQLWSEIQRMDCFDFVFSATVSNCIHFSEPESASALIKVLVAAEEADKLVEITCALLEQNSKFQQSRSLQTLYLIHLIPKDESEAEAALDKYNHFAIEEVIKACIESNRLRLALKILKTNELWPYAFKVALYALKDIQEASKIAELCKSDECSHALLEFHLLQGDCDAAIELSKQLNPPSFRSRELILLLATSRRYQELYDYLCSLRDHNCLEVSHERIMFDCLVKLDRIAELEEFISTASSKTAADLGHVLLNGKRFLLAGESFAKAGDFDRSVACYLRTGSVEKTSEYAMKSSNVKIWIQVVKATIKRKEYEMAHKLALKVLQQNSQQYVQIIFTIYNNHGAFDELIAVFEEAVAISSPNRDLLIGLGSMYAQHGRSEQLEAFMNKYHALLPATFVNILAEHRLWKESFKFFVLSGDLDRALQLFIAHPLVQLDAKKVAAVLPRLKNPQALLPRLLAFYCEFDGEAVVELKQEFVTRLGLNEVVNFLKERDLLFVIEEELKRSPSTGGVGLDLFIKSNNYYGLIEAIKNVPSQAVDSLALAQKLRDSEHRHFRVLSGKLLSNCGQHGEALKVLIKENAVVDCLLVLCQTGNTQYSEAFLARYARAKNVTMFVTASYVLFDQIRLDVLFEHSQRIGNCGDVCLPLYCQHLRNKFK